MIAPMMLAGIRVSSELVRELAEIVDEPTASMLARALEMETVVVALTIEDRERIIRALDDPPAGLAELRGVLLREHEWRKRTGLI
jgi:hypothetical protein